MLLSSPQKTYLKDLVLSALAFPEGVTSPRVWRGYFRSDEIGRVQKNVFGYLLTKDFKRTPFQIIGAGQTAGLIKCLSDNASGISEAHIRFYRWGAIDCELECGRFDAKHYRGKRVSGKDFLEQILITSTLSTEDKPAAIEMQQDVDFSRLCVADPNINEWYNPMIGLAIANTLVIPTLLAWVAAYHTTFVAFK